MNDDRLWSIEDIGEWIGVSKASVRRNLICKTTFPKPVILPTGGQRGSHRRWVPEEVKKWVLRHRE